MVVQNQDILKWKVNTSGRYKQLKRERVR